MKTITSIITAGLGMMVLGMAIGAGAIGSKAAADDGKEEIQAPTTHTADEMDDRTPLGLMPEFFHTLPAGGIEKARSYYHATTEAGKRETELAAANDLALSLLEQAVRKQFGGSAVASIDRALGYQAEEDIDKGKVTMDGDRIAVMKFPEDAECCAIKVDGHWKIDSDALAAKFPEPRVEKKFDDVLAHQQKLKEQLTKDVLAGKYKTAEELATAAKSASDLVNDAEWPTTAASQP